MTRRCVKFWESLERQAEKRGMLLTSGEGDPTDVFFVEYRDREPEEITDWDESYGEDWEGENEQ